MLVNWGKLIKSDGVSKLPRLFSIMCRSWNDPPKVVLSSKWHVESPCGDVCFTLAPDKGQLLTGQRKGFRTQVLGRHEKGEEAVKDGEGS